MNYKVRDRRLGIANLVSVIVCNWNYGRYLSECLDSIIKQTYRPIQLVFVDDGSTDDSIEVYKSKIILLEKEGIKHDSYFYKHNGGRIRSLNKAIQMSNGKFCTIVDSDDILYDKFIETSEQTLDMLRKHDPKVGFVYTNLDIIDKNGKTISYGISEEFDAEKTLVNSYIPDCGLTLTQILKACYPFNPTVRVNTKHHKWQQIVKAGWKGKLIHSSLYKYRMHENNISGISKRITSDQTRLIEKWHPHK